MKGCLIFLPLRFLACSLLPSQKRRHLVPISADGHRTPTPAARPRIIVEEKLTSGIGAAANRGAWSFDEKLRRRARDRRQEPIEAAFPGNKLQRPPAAPRHQLVMTLGASQNLVNGFDPRSREGLVVHGRIEDHPQAFAQAKDTQTHSVDGMGLGPQQRPEPCGAIFCDQPRIY